MPVPETTIYHYCDTIFGQDNIRTSRQFLIMQTKTKSTSVQSLPNQNFRLGVLATDVGHAVMSLMCIQLIHIAIIYIKTK